MSLVMNAPTLRLALINRTDALVNALLVSLGTLFIAAMAQLSVPLPGSPVPFTGQTLAVLLVGTAYGSALGATTVLSYLIAGVIGAPFYSNGGHGFSHLSGATGGYLIGMFLASYIAGKLAEHKWDQSIIRAVPAMLLSNVAIFTCGLFWLHHVTQQSWSWTIAHGLTPFILVEIIKVLLASTSLPFVWGLLARLK